MRTFLMVMGACALLLFGSAGCGDASQQPLPGSTADWSDQLPAITELDGLAGDSVRHAATADYDLIMQGPLMPMMIGVYPEPGKITLKPGDAGGLTYAVYRLSGLGTDGSVYPVSLTQEFTGALYYIGVADYARGTWRFFMLGAGGAQALEGGPGLVSPGGNSYLVVVGYQFNVTLTQLKLTLNNAIPGAPTAVIAQQGDAAELWPAAFNATGSDPGLGAFTTFTYTFDGWGEQVVNDPAAEVVHTFDTIGPHTVQLRVANDLGLTDTTQLQVEVGPVVTDLLVVYNSDIPESVDLASYYTSPRTGRSIHPDYILGLPLGAADSATITRADYNSLIRDPLKSYLDSSGLKNIIKYILLCKGVPYQLSDGGNSAAVDSELCMLYADLDGADPGYPYDSWLINDPKGLVFGGTGFYMQDNAEFQAFAYEACYDPTYENPNSGDETSYTISYLVGRLSAYTYADAKAIVDRSLAADISGTGWVVLDSSDQLYSGTPFCNMDTMVDPVWPWSVPDAAQSGYELLNTAGFNVFQDITGTRITATQGGLPAGAADNILGYCSWGVHAGHSNTYILSTLGFTYRPGAVFMSYESYNGERFFCSNPDDLTQGHSGQGQICDFFRMGGTVAIGNVYEPFTIGVGDERWVFYRYIVGGDRFIEAAYKGLRLLSWQEVVVGDPLCRVAP
jgi:uncharacterized protein (TIGR03790 family)